MSRALRLAGGWALVLTAAIVLNLVIASPTSAPELDVLGGTRTPTPQPSAGSSLADPDPSPSPASPSTGADIAPLRPVVLAPLADATAAGLQASLDRVRRSLGLQAVAVGVAIAGSRGWTGASGTAGDGTTPLDGESPFGIASITKTFTAAVVMQLVEEGRLSLSDEVAALLPQAGVPPGVTVRQLLSHTSGIADLLAPMRDAMNADPSRRWTGPEVLARVGDPWFRPGLGYRYSNTNFVVLGMLVERVTGRPFAEVVHDRLLDPLRLTDTGMLLTVGAPPLMTPSWASAFGTSGAMYSSARDLLEWGVALYDGRVLQRATLAQMLAVGTSGYGLGTERVTVGERAGYGHSGLLRGYTALLVQLPAEQLTLVLLGTWQGFDPGQALALSVGGEPSILDLALAAGSDQSP